ncbi:DUF2252 family protein [Microbacterium sp. LWH3-1.2]|uniref:DUF2252 family protein n=1 Tax=Microbacterium sp. LWH3-1.2 TaxID=3135256 RepID=UPI00344A586C
MHFAREVVGVGSVGTRVWIVLMRGRGDSDPLLLQGCQRHLPRLAQTTRARRRRARH